MPRKKKPTPGPWLTAEGEWIHEPNDLLIETENAWLMGTAPEILDALKKAEWALSLYVAKREDSAFRDQTDVHLKEIRAAIARAEGRSL